MSLEESQPLREPIISIRGQKVGLGPIQREDVPRFVQWLNDFEVTRTLGIFPGTGRLTLKAEEEWYDKTYQNPNNYAFGIYELNSGQLIGNCALSNVDLVGRTAIFGIMIGAKEHWNKGFGTEATQLILDYGFNVLGLHNVMLTADANNLRGVRAYEKAGFKLIGRQRQARRIGGEAHDIVYMDILSTEFQSPVLKAVLTP